VAGKTEGERYKVDAAMIMGEGKLKDLSLDSTPDVDDGGFFCWLCAGVRVFRWGKRRGRGGKGKAGGGRGERGKGGATVMIRRRWPHPTGDFGMQQKRSFLLVRSSRLVPNPPEKSFLVVELLPGFPDLVGLVGIRRRQERLKEVLRWLFFFPGSSGNQKKYRADTREAEYG